MTACGTKDKCLERPSGPSLIGRGVLQSPLMNFMYLNIHCHNIWDWRYLSPVIEIEDAGAEDGLVFGLGLADAGGDVV